MKVLAKSKPRIGWIVDVQFDFMVPAAQGGRLYVHDLNDPSDPGATRILVRLTRTVDWINANCDAVVYTGDWHKEGDPELDPVAPDPTKGTYPWHCMGASADPVLAKGAALIAAVAPQAEPIVLARDAANDDAERVAGTALDSHRPIFIQKSRFSVFEGNPASAALVKTLVERLTAQKGEVEFVVCGVATDVCVKAAVEGLLDYGAVTIVRDAVAGLGLEADDVLLAKWAALGAHITDSASWTVATAADTARLSVTSVTSGAAPMRNGIPQ
jgi:nicotinamidase-related amidase